MTLVAKTNVLTFGHDLWDRTFQDVAKEYTDVDHHSGETPVGTDWSAYDGNIVLPPVPGGVRVIAWYTSTFNQDPNANAIRWGTSFTFSIQADTPPSSGHVALRVHKPGTGKYLYIPAQVPF